MVSRQSLKALDGQLHTPSLLLSQSSCDLLLWGVSGQRRDEARLAAARRQALARVRGELPLRALVYLKLRHNLHLQLTSARYNRSGVVPPLL